MLPSSPGDREANGERMSPYIKKVHSIVEATRKGCEK
jgi:hypothetical protein